MWILGCCWTWTKKGLLPPFPPPAGRDWSQPCRCGTGAWRNLEPNGRTSICWYREKPRAFLECHSGTYWRFGDVVSVKSPLKPNPFGFLVLFWNLLAERVVLSWQPRLNRVVQCWSTPLFSRVVPISGHGRSNPSLILCLLIYRRTCPYTSSNLAFRRKRGGYAMLRRVIKVWFAVRDATSGEWGSNFPHLQDKTDTVQIAHLWRRAGLVYTPIT